MRVLHVISGMDHRQGGPTFALFGLAGAQHAIGLDVTCFVGVRPGDSPELPDALARIGVRIIRCGPCRGPLATCPTMRGDLGRAVADADICHIHGVWMQIQHEAVRACRVHGVPYIFRPCGMLDPWCLRQSRIRKMVYMAWRLRRNLNGAAAMHFTSETERRLVAPLGLRPPGLVEPGGVDLSEFAALPPRGTFRALYPAVGDRAILLFLGRVHPKKGLDLLIPAFARVRPPGWMLVIAGPDDRDSMGAIRRMVEVERLQDDVLFTGLLRGEARLAAFVDGDLFCLPSYQENFGVAVVEALAAGLPVIVSDQVNIHDDITRGEVGAVVPCEVDALADAIAAWTRDGALRAAAAARARPFVAATWDWSAIARRWAGHYERIVRGSAPAARRAG
ncbi:MAG: glycosyltransferase [Phycisphaeraceae bacterium]|nr:glycosyltransferase [Phycisphaeraceae bacterium]